MEGGGTRFVVAVRDAATDETLLHEPVPTTDAATTLGRVRELLGTHGPLAAVGVACFGPLDTAAGRLFDTPKPTWAGADLRQGILPRPDVQVRFETDVVGAALGEQARGAGQGCRDLVYVTIGTGIGAGLLQRLLKPVLTTEAGLDLFLLLRDTEVFRPECLPADCHFKQLSVGPFLVLNRRRHGCFLWGQSHSDEAEPLTGSRSRGNVETRFDKPQPLQGLKSMTRR